MSSTRKQIWVLVLFDEEKVLSHPIPLGEVQDLSGRNGEEADLREGDECMAQYYVGDRMRKATILRRSESREELNEVYKELLGIAKENEASQRKSTSWQWTKKLGAGILVGGAAVAAAPVVLSAAGFSSGGIVAGSLAARLMSMAAIANGGGVAAGGWIAACQSAGAAGISATTNLIIGTTAGAAGTLAASKLSKKETQEDRSSEDMCSKLKGKSPGNPKSAGCSADPPTPEEADPPSNSTVPTPETLEADQPSPIPPENSLSPEEVEDLISHVEDININAQAEAEHLYLENQRLHEEKQCKICMDAEMDILFIPCGHLCTCRHCAVRLKDCPICKKKIQQLHRVYKS